MNLKLKNEIKKIEKSRKWTPRPTHPRHDHPYSPQHHLSRHTKCHLSISLSRHPFSPQRLPKLCHFHLNYIVEDMLVHKQSWRKIMGSINGFSSPFAYIDMKENSSNFTTSMAVMICKMFCWLTSSYPIPHSPLHLPSPFAGRQWVFSIYYFYFNNKTIVNFKQFLI